MRPHGLARGDPPSSAAVSELSAVRALFGEIPTRGRLPVTIPGVAARGDGITR